MKFVSFAFVLLLAFPASAQRHFDDNAHRLNPDLKTVYCQRPMPRPHGEFMECSVTGGKGILLPLINAHMSDYEVMRDYTCTLVTYETGSQAVRCPTTLAEKPKKI
jgi:hypothetical protein